MRFVDPSKLTLPAKEDALPGRADKDAAQKAAAEASRNTYQSTLQKAGYGPITTEIIPAPEFYYAEEYHQQYLAKNPAGYCGHGGTGVACPIGLKVRVAPEG